MHMRAMVLLLLIPLVASSGCIENMGDLKAALGFVPPAPPPAVEPTYLPPFARATVNATSALAGSPLRFSSEGSRDPQGLALDYAWDFGDGRKASLPVSVHAFTAPGEYRVALRVTNEKGLHDTTTLVVQVARGNLAPTASLSVSDANGEPTRRAEAGARLLFDASGSADPEGTPLSYEWDFGDGATSHDAAPTHVFTAPGRFVVKLKVTDAAGLAATAQQPLLVSHTYAEKGAFEVAAAASRAHTFAIGEGGARLHATLTFPAGFGGNDLRLVVKDARGTEVGGAGAAPPPGAQGVEVRVVEVDGAALAKAAAGAWTFEVVRASGVQVEYELTVRQEY